MATQDEAHELSWPAVAATSLLTVAATLYGIL